MPVRRTTLSLCIILLACLLGMGATFPLAAAEQTGLLAILQPATNDAPAELKFYSPGAQLVHAVPLDGIKTLSAQNLSPDGLHWSYATGAVSGPEDAAEGKTLQSDLTLHIRRTLDGGEVAAIPLLPPNFPQNIKANAALLLERDPTLDEVGDLEEALWQAFKSSLGAFAWSPDGTQLAFSAATDGPSSDLYLYDVQEGSISRLSDGIEQIQDIRWSPDGEWIWHTTISYGYCMVCDGHNYAAAADGSRMVTLPGNDVFLFLAWVDGDSYLVTDQANGPGAFDLQLVDLPTGTSRSLWPGVHRTFIYDPAMNRLAVTGTRGQRFDPDEQLFIVDLSTGEEREFDDLESALEAETWLAPLGERPVRHPCARPGPIVYPCIELPFDPLSPDGAYWVGDGYAVEEVASGEQLFPPLPNLPARSILWRPDSAGFFFPQAEKVLYRDLSSGDVTTIENATLLGWLPQALPDAFASAAPPTATPVATVEIISPFRRTTLEGSPVVTAHGLRLAQSQELAETAQELLAEDEYWVERPSGLPLLLAREAVATTFEPYPPLVRDPFVQPEAAAALDAVLAASPPRIAAYPALDRIPTIASLALSPDGTIIATGHGDGSVRLWDYEIGTLIRVMPSATTAIDHLVFSPDGAMVAAGDRAGKVVMWEVARGLQLTTYSGRYVDTYAIAWRPRSNDLAIANGSDPIMIRPRNQAAYPLLDAQAEALAYSPDGSQLAVALRPPQPPLTDGIWQQSYGEPEQRPLWIVDAETGELLHELPDDRSTHFMSYTPDGETLLVGSGYRLRAWNIASGDLRYEITLPDFRYGWAISPDGTQLIITTNTNGISTYELASGDHLGDMPVRVTITYPLAIHPQDGYLISSYNSLPLLMDPADGTPIIRFGRTRADFVVTSPATSLFATADNHIVTVQDLVDERVIYELADSLHWISDLAISADGKWLAARAQSGDLLLWELDYGQLQWHEEVRGEYGGLVAFAPGGELVIGGSEGVLMVIDPKDGSTLGELTVDGAIVSLEVSSRHEIALIAGVSSPIALRVHLDELLNGADEATVTVQEMGKAPVFNGEIAYSPDGSLLAVARGTTATSQATLELWETAANRSIRTIELADQYTVEALAFSPDGQSIVTGASYGAPITLWDVATGQKIQSLGGSGSTIASQRLAFTPDGAQLFATAMGGITTRYALTPTHDLRTMEGHSYIVWEVDTHPDGHTAITAGEDHSVRLWDWQTGAQLTELPDQPARVYTVDISPDGNFVLVGGYDGQPRLYYLSGALIHTFPSHDAFIVDALFRPDGEAFATSSFDGSIRVWKPESAELSWEIEGLATGGGALAYSPDSTLLAGSADGGPDSVIYLWDAQSGEELMQLHGHDNFIIALAFSPDGALLASASWDHTIKLWEVATGELVGTLEGHTEILTGLAFSPDGSLLASVAEDYTLRLWDVSTAAPLTTIQMPRTLPWSVRFSNDGHALLTTHADGTLRSWLVDANDSSTEAKLLLAAARVPRATAEFTAQERRRYAIDTYAGGYLSASGNVNLRPEPFVESMVIQPITSPQTGNIVGGNLFALTNEHFLLTSTNQGESWRIITRLPFDFLHATLGVLVRPDDPLLLATDKGLYRVDEDGALTLINSAPLSAVSYSHTNTEELWAISDYQGNSMGNQLLHSLDGGTTWSEVSDKFSYQMFPPLLLTPPADFPQLITASVQESPLRIVWRVPAADSDEWDALAGISLQPNNVTPEQGMAWDAQSHTLYVSNADGELLASEHVDIVAAEEVTAVAIANFGPGTRPVPLAVAPGPILYVNLITSSRPKLLRGTWDGFEWHWVELGLPLVGAG